MSDGTEGPGSPGWWRASDGKWYPPDQAPAVPPADTWATPTPGPPPPSGMSGGAKAALVGLALVGLAVVIGLGALLLGGEDESSSGDGTEAPVDDGEGTTADLPDGFHLIAGEGVSIGAPDGWEEISPEDAAMSPEELDQAFPDLSDSVLEQGAAAVDQGSVLVAFDVESGSFDNVNIIEIPTRIELSQMERQAEMELTAMGADVGSIEEAPIPAGDALRAEYTVDVALPDGSTTPVEGVQYYVVTDDRTFVVTFSSANDIDDLAATIDTFRVG